MSLLWAPRFAQRPRFFSRSVGNKGGRATTFSQRLLVKLHRYCDTIGGSKLPLSQVYFAVSLLPFGESRQLAKVRELSFVIVMYLVANC